MENGQGVSDASDPTSTGFNKELKTVNTNECENNGFAPISETNMELNQLQKVPENLHNASDPCVYRHDIVRSSKYDGLVGIVTEVAGDFDSEGEYSESSDDDGSDDGGDAVDEDENRNVEGERSNHSHRHVQKHGDHKNDDSLSDGQVRVIWTNNTETINSLHDLAVVDRGFLHGDIVAAALDPTGQLGLVVDVNISVDLRAASGAIISNISSRDLQRVRHFAVGDYVVHGRGPWLGRVDEILDNVTVLFDDGSICKVLKADPLRLKSASKNILDDSSFPYYPGQRVRAVSSSVFKSSRWLSGLWKPSRLEGTVIKVQVGAVYVYWIASANHSAMSPPEEQNPKNLTVLSCFSHANWQLGDWCLFFPTEDRAEKYSHLISTEHHIVSHATTSVRSDKKTQFVQSGDHNNIVSKSCLDGDRNTAGNNGLHDSGSCSNPLSVSKEITHDNLPASRKKIRKILVKRDKSRRKKEEIYESPSNCKY
ncbi:putative ubiquitin-conjugating enzyme E2 23 [Acorus calamus]|uniref:Ubiquitin-conjugating enzyme E2 23 n=1 Tax=Acorus calamus TaxID=4465 RepID=A0AAV9DW02_ACOCL|nr:putative ubiquitin-conjugating enzyme E2 23 [Acorus calamus]